MYKVKSIGRHYVVLKNGNRVYINGSYEKMIGFLKKEKDRMEKLGLSFKVNLKQVEQDVYEYTY